MRRKNKKWLIIPALLITGLVIVGTLFLTKPNFLRGSLGGFDLGQRAGQQAIRDVNQIMAPSGAADLSSFNILPLYQPEYEKLYPAYNGIRATAYLENIDFSLRANSGKIEGAGRSFSRRQSPSGNWITILKYESNLKQVMGDDVCPYIRGLSYAGSHCTWMPINPARGELGKSFGRYVIFNFDTTDKPSTLRGTVTIKQSSARDDSRGDSAIEIFTVLSGGTRWDWRATCDKVAGEIQKDCNFTLPEGYKAGQVVVARSFKYDHSGTGVFGGTPYVWDIQIENVKIPDPKIVVFSKGIGGGSWTSRLGAVGELSRDGEIRTATIIGLDGKTYTQTIGLSKCLEDGSPGTKLEETLRGKNRNEAEYIAGQVQKTTGQKLLGAVDDLIQGKKAPGQDIGMCDHSNRCKKAEELLNNAGGGAPSDSKVGGRDRSWAMEGESGDATDKADKAAKEQIQAIKDLPEAEKVAREAREQADKLRQMKEDAKDLDTEAKAAKKAAEESYKKAVENENPAEILREEQRLIHTKEEAKKAAEEKTKQDSGPAVSARLKAEREAKEKAENATETKRKATGDETACSPMDDRCIDKKAAARFQKNLQNMNRFIPPAGQIDFKKEKMFYEKTAEERRLEKLPWLVNPNPNPQGENPIALPPNPKTVFEECVFGRDKEITVVNPGEEGFQDRCFEDCPMADVVVGQQCGENTAGQTHSVPIGTCEQNRMSSNNRSTIDCPQDNPNCGKNIGRRCRDGGFARILCRNNTMAGREGTTIIGCPETEGGQCEGVNGGGGRPMN